MVCGAMSHPGAVLEAESTEKERVKFLQEAAVMGQFKNPASWSHHYLRPSEIISVECHKLL